jgi:hypothetical protein
VGQTGCLEEVEASRSLDAVEVSGSLGLVSLSVFTQALLFTIIC